MFKKLEQVIKRAAISRVGQILFVAHTILAVYATTESLSKEHAVYHFENEPILFKIVSIIDFPATLIDLILTSQFCDQFSPCSVWFFYGVLFFCASIQWWITGYWIERFATWRRNSLKSG